MKQPIIATDVPGCREVVEHGENGLLVPPRDSEALASAILELVDDEPRRTVMGAAGRRLVEARFDEKQIIETTLKKYRSLLERD